MSLRVTYDPAKNDWNIRTRGLAFDSARDFDFETALVAIDRRREYGETRYIAIGMLGTRLHVLCFAETQDGIRVISFRKANLVRCDDMSKRKHLSDAKGEVAELSAADLKAFRPAQEVLPESLRRKVGVRGPQRSPTKERITIRLSPDVVQSFRATGEGWQTRVDAALKDWLKKHKPTA